MPNRTRTIYKSAIKELDAIWSSSPIALLLCLAGLYTALWAYHTKPLPGISIGLLATAAAVMSIRPAMNFPEKLCWIVILAFFLVAEIHSIHADRDKADRQAIADRKMQDGDFANILKAQSQAFGQVINAQNKDFAVTAKHLTSAYKTSQHQFNTTIATLIKTHQEDESGFAGVLVKQDRAFEAQRDLSEQFIGRLVPGDSPTPANACSARHSLNQGDVLVISGDSADIAKRFPRTVLMVGNFPVMSVDRVEHSDNLAISVDMRDELNRILFRMDKNGVVNRSNLIFLHPDKSTFLLQDIYGKEIFKAQFVNPQTFAISGMLAYCGHLFPVQNPHVHEYCGLNNTIGTLLEAPSCPTVRQ